MLGYSLGMHKFNPRWRAATLAVVVALVAPSAVAQARKPPLQAVTPIRIAPPTPALAAAFDAADQAGLDPLVVAGFSGQPLAGWLEYAALRKRLDTLPLASGDAFLSAHANTAVGTAFRTDWLLALAKRNQWPAFLSDWDAGIDNTTLRCLRLQALMAVNRTDAAWTADAQALWRSSGRSLPGQCDAPFALLAAQGGLPDALRWERFDLAAADAQTGVMRAIAAGLPSAEAAQVNAYSAYVDTPSAAVAAWPVSPRSRLVASTALAKLAKNSPDQAEALLPGVATALAFTDADRGRVLYQVALWTAASYLPAAAQRLANVPEASYDAALYEVRVREALARSDWAAALTAILKMPEAQRNDSRWLYFAARTSELTGAADAAKTLYARAARSTDFHGFLAADRLNQAYALCPWQPAVTPAMKQAVARDPALVRALQLYALGRKSWAVREWNAALSHFTATQRQIAVDVAQDNGWFDRAVFSLLKVDGKRYPDEQRLYQLRFPLHHADSIRREAARNQLDPAWIAAEIRAESIFDPNARSPADARGLMQVLPSTGAAVAARIGMPWRGGDSLFDADTNITLGSAYLRQLVDRFGGKPYQVIAGYNAGPGTLNRWLSQRPGMDPDFWIETISYKETRDYVARVLSFSTVYDWRLNGDAHRLSDRLLGMTNGARKSFACPPAQASAEPATTPDDSPQ